MREHQLDAGTIAWERFAEATYFAAKGSDEIRAVGEFEDREIDAGGGEVPLRSASEWRRRFRAFRAGKSRPVWPHRIAQVVIIGRQRVLGRARRIQRRPVVRPASGVSSDDDGGSGPPPAHVEIRCSKPTALSSGVRS